MKLRRTTCFAFVICCMPRLAGAADLRVDAGLAGALYGICVAYTSSGNECLNPEQWESHSCESLRDNFSRQSGGLNIDEILAQNGATEIIDETGGTISLEGVAHASFPSGAFATQTSVSLTSTSDEEIGAIFDEFAAIFRPQARLSYEVRITTGSLPPLSEVVTLTMEIPDDFVASVPVDHRIEAFALIEQGSNEETPFPVFDLIPTTQNIDNQSVTLELPGAAFFSSTLTNHEYQAIVTIAPTPGFGSSLLSTNQLSMSSETCEASSILCPLSAGCTVTSAFNPARAHPITGVVQPHNGVDYAAQNGDVVVAAADGSIERSYTSTSYGETIVLRHANGSATLYAHLQARHLSVGDSVSAGDQLGTADSTGASTGPHLHFEYVPNGEIIQSKDRIDPHPCIDELATGSITVADSGSLADDAFQLSLDGIVIGSTTIGGSNTVAISNIIPGPHLLELLVLIAPDDVGTYTVTLNDGLTFFDGTTSKSGAPPEGTIESFEINVPDPSEL